MDLLNVIYTIYYYVTKLFKLLKLYEVKKVKGILYTFFSNLGSLLYRLSLYTRQNNELGILKTNNKKKVIISLTSFPDRIHTVWICIETLLNQSLKPDLIILWLAESEFKDGLKGLPKRLVDLQNRGLTIRFCENIKPHKKYYYTLKEYPNDFIITVDDDVLYPKSVVRTLVELNSQNPECICCIRGHRITFNKNSKILPYRKWIKNPETEEEPSKFICPTGVGGVLYPPGSLNKEVFNIESIKNLCLNADDLWLKIMSIKNSTKVIKSNKFKFEFLTIQNSQSKSLSQFNVNNDKNDEQLKAILEKYKVYF
jgi:hypothetical protein